MPLSIEFADHYVKTVLDFWLLRPRGFFAEKNRDPSRYLSPYQFLFATLSIGFVIYVAAFTLNLSATQADPSSALVSAHVIRLLTFLVVLLFLNSLIFRAISRIWPVRGNATFSSIFGFQCYMQAILLPAMVLDLLLGSLLTELLARETLPAWSILIPATVGYVLGVVGLLFWNLPGIAVVNGVSMRRVLAGLLFWSVALGFVVGIVVGVLIALRSLPA